MIQEGEEGCAHRAPPPEVETVREWSHTHNQALWHKHLLPDALRFLLEKSALRSRHLQAFIEDFKLDPDAALPHLQMFLTAPARLGRVGARRLQAACALARTDAALAAAGARNQQSRASRMPRARSARLRMPAGPNSWPLCQKHERRASGAGSASLLRERKGRRMIT